MDPLKFTLMDQMKPLNIYYDFIYTVEDFAFRN